MIHSHSGLSNVQKLNYLRLSLSGKAASATGTFTICDDNYDVARSHLKEIYDNKRAVVLRHAVLLRDTVIPDDSSESIRDLVNHMQLHIRSLQALGRSWEDVANDLITSIVVSKMVNDTRKTWERTLSDREVPKITDIFKYLYNASHQCKDYITHEKPQRKTESSKVYSNRFRHPLSPRMKHRTFVTNGTNRNSDSSNNSNSSSSSYAKKWTCILCNAGSHAVF